MVRAADEWAAGDMAEAFGEGDFLVFGKFFGSDVFDHRQVFGAWAEVLAEGEDGHVVGAEVIEGLENFVMLFAESEHDATFGGDHAVDHGGGFFQNGETAVVLGA